MRIDFNQEQGIWVATASYEERHPLKAAGFWWHDRGSCRYSGCRACAAGVHKQWWTFKADVANRVSGAATAPAQQALTGHRKALEESKAVEATLDIPCPDGLAYMPFQKAGIEFASKRANTLLADDMGLGKSIQAVGLINLKKYTKILIVCPASLRINWQREAEKWLVDKTLRIKVVLDGSVDGLDSNIVIVNFDRLKDGVLSALMGQTWDLLVVDECHACKNTKAQRTTKVLGSYNRQTKSKAPGLVDRARNKLFLTGTPILNRPIEIQPIAGALAPTLFGNFFVFAKRYADAVQTKYGWDFTGASNLDELQEKLRSSIMIRRKKADVLTDLPPKTRQIVVLPTNGATKAVQAEMWQGEDLDDLHADAEVALTSEDTAAYAAAVRRLDAAIKIAFEDMSEVRHNTAVAKIPAVLEHVRDVLDGGVAKVVVFAHHKDVIEALAKEFGASAVVLDGSTPNEMRQVAVDRFQNDPNVQVFIGSIRAAGVGITLTAASHVIFAELDWVPGWVTQSEDRCLTEDNLVLCLRFGCNKGMSLKKVKDVAVGDTVLTHTGNVKKVTATHAREHRGMLTTIHYMGWPEPLVCTHDHKVLIKRNGVVGWMRACSVLPSDSLVFPKMRGEQRLDQVTMKDAWRLYQSGEKPSVCSVEGCNEKIEARNMCRVHYREVLQQDSRPPCPVQINSRYVRLPDSIKITNDWLYLLGWYVAKGFSSLLPGKSRFVSFSGHQRERPILKRISRVLAAYGIKSTIYSKTNTKGIELRAYSGELALWFRDWFGHGANYKFLPPEIMNLPAEQAKIFLQGYLKGDGYKRGNQMEWVSASEVLSYQICMLAIRTGHIPRMRRGSAKSGNHWVGRYTIDTRTCNPRLADQNKRYIFCPVRSVMTENAKKKVRVYDITVEDDHSFTTGLCTVHNCHRIGQRSNVLVQHLVLDGSIDAKLANILVWKQQIIDSALDKDAPKIEVTYTESEQVALPKPKHSYPVATPEQRAALVEG